MRSADLYSTRRFFFPFPRFELGEQDGLACPPGVGAFDRGCAGGRVD